jgi:hypothetical protein
MGGGAGSRLRKARRVLAWIRSRDANQFSREDVRDGLGLALNAHQSLHVIWLLEGVGFLRKAAYEPESAGRLRLRRDVNPAVIGISLAETAETPRRLPVVASVLPPVLIGAALAEIAEIHSQAPSGDQGFAHQGFAGAPVVSPTAGVPPSRAACRAGS